MPAQLAEGRRGRHLHEKGSGELGEPREPGGVRPEAVEADVGQSAAATKRAGTLARGLGIGCRSGSIPSIHWPIVVPREEPDRSEKAALMGVPDEFRTAMQRELLRYPPAIGLDGFNTHMYFLSDLPMRIPLR